MKTRLLTSTYIVIALILTLVSRMLTPYIFDIVIGAMAVMGCVEVGRVFERSKQYNNIYLVGSFPAVLFIGFVSTNDNWIGFCIFYHSIFTYIDIEKTN